MSQLHSQSLPSGSRRQFLLAGSAAIAGAMLLGGDVVSLPSGLELLASSAGPRIPMAYIKGSAGAGSLAAALAGPSRAAVPAAGMRVADSLAGRSVRVSVRGFSSPSHAQRSSSFGRVLLDAHVPSPSDPSHTIPFYAFTFRRDPSVSQSMPSTLHAAAGRGLRLGLRLDTAGATATPAAATAVFASRPQRGLPTLQPGVYLLGLHDGMWSSATTLPSVTDAAWAGLPALVLVVEAEEGE